jgi:1,2-dihydroxy-3-keto-5-methylthiopentene dioxygenase
MTERGYRSVEVISSHRDQPLDAEVSRRFLKEHQGEDDELRFFVAGRGLFNLHIGDFVYAVQCDKHDLISVPAHTRQWFDMGQAPHLVAIRLFKSAQGGALTFTGDDIAEQFPGLDD